MKIFDLNYGYEPRQHPLGALLNGVVAGCFAGMGMFTAQLFLAPFHPSGESLDPVAAWQAYQMGLAGSQMTLRLIVSGAVAGLAAWVAYRDAARNTPLTEPFISRRSHEPRLWYGDDARVKLWRRFREEYGAKDKRQGLYLAPYLSLPFAAELKNILVVGNPNSGKSNIVRALVDQAIARKNLVFLLCNKGDVTRSFLSREAILIAPHHADSHALDLAADITDAGAAMQFAVDLIPASTPRFWSDCAQLIFVDIILNEIATRGHEWNARTLLDATLQDSKDIRAATHKIALNAGALLPNSDPETEDKTVTGILMTMRSGAFANLRFFAWAWDKSPKDKRFSIRNWLSSDYTGPRTVIAQFSAEYEDLSAIVIGGLIKRICRSFADAKLAVDPTRRVILALDEFNVLPRVEGLARAMGVGREKGLVILMGLQNISQLIEGYGEHLANVIFGLFQIKIYGRLDPGDSTEKVEKWLGRRHVSTIFKVRAPKAGDTSKQEEEKSEIPTFSATELADKLGIFVGKNGQSHVRALVHCYGHAYLLEWPLTLWNDRRPGFTPAAWLTQIPTTPKY